MSNAMILNTAGLLFLIVAASFTGPLLSCDMQDQLQNQMWTRHTVAILLILFFMLVVNRDRYRTAAEEVNWVTPLLLMYAIGLYAFFLMLSRMKLEFSLVVISSVLLHMLLSIEIDAQANSTFPDRQTRVDDLQRMQQILAYVAGVTALFGFAHYFIKQRRDYGDGFSFQTFMLGTPRCRRFAPVSVGN